MPPLPAVWNLPFQVSAGSHTSKLTAGSLVAVTRQNAGTSSGRAAPGGVNSPAGTASASLIVVSGSASPASAPHAAGSAGRAALPAWAAPWVDTAVVASSAAAAAHPNSVIDRLIISNPRRLRLPFPLESSWPRFRVTIPMPKVLRRKL